MSKNQIYKTRYKNKNKITKYIEHFKIGAHVLTLIKKDDEELVPAFTLVARDARMPHADALAAVDRIMEAFEQYGNSNNTRIIDINNGINLDTLESQCYEEYIREGKHEPANAARRIRTLMERFQTFLSASDLRDVLYFPNINNQISEMLSEYAPATRSNYEAFIRKGFEVLEAMVVSDDQINLQRDALPRGFVPALRRAVDNAISQQKIKSLRELEITLFGKPNKIFFVFYRNSILQKVEDVIKIEAALDLPPGTLTERYYSWRQSRKLDLKYEAVPLLSVFPEDHPIRQNTYHQVPLKSMLPADLLHRTNEEKQQIVKWVTETFYYDTTNFRAAQIQKTTVIKKQIALDVDCPEQLQTDWERWLYFKTAKITEHGMLRKKRWEDHTPDFYRRYIADVFNALLLEYEFSTSDIRLAHLCFPQVLRRAVDILTSVRAVGADEDEVYTNTHVQMLKRLKSLITEPDGYYLQKHLPRDLKPLNGLVSDEDIRNARENWLEFCVDANKILNQYIHDVDEYLLKRDPFYPIAVVLDQDEPIVYFSKVLTYMDEQTPGRMNNKIAYITNRIDAAIFHMGLEAPLRNENSIKILRRKNFDDRKPIDVLEKEEEGELLYTGDGKYIIRIPVKNFKNKHSSFFKGYREWTTPVSSELGKRFEDLERDVYPLMSGEPKYIFAKRNGSDFDEEYINRRWRNMIAQYAIFNPFNKTGVIPGLKLCSYKSRRHIVATSIVKKTKNLELASWALCDSVEMVRKVYGRFLPSEKTKNAHEVLARMLYGSTIN